MPLTWNEARELEYRLQAEIEERQEAERQATFPTYKVGDKARITKRFHEDRAWGDTVTITYIGTNDGHVSYGADHEVYGDVGWIFFPDELEPITEPVQEG